ncbi:serine/threonine-protein kinase [Actinomadura physcomitrii]|uniref:serine/threonine-protein kinase n=1 Tax=Actinomadura physcomitrii TaxID=2650748 RepID=UPI00192071EF|nr:serine/threonine-protein kinase [Actinomadura physcomitrii]
MSTDDPRTVAGYALRARLGGGGMGRVYLSFTPGRRAVAVKVVRGELADDPEFRRRFRREVDVAQRVQGFYTAPVLDADPDAPQPWLATAYVAGPTLQEAVAEHGPLPPPTVAHILAGCAEALASVHAAGLVHRDFKPGNVLLADDGPKVIDFGIARAADASTLTRSGAVVGTPAFMAPEQITGGTIGPAADVFALGLTAFHAATGHSAFGEGNAQALMYRIVNTEPDLDGCPAELRPLIGRCLVKEPAGRPSPAEITEAAGALVTGGPSDDGRWLPPAIATTMAGYHPPDELRPPPTTPAPAPTAPPAYAGPPTGPTAYAGPPTGPAPYGPTAAFDRSSPRGGVRWPPVAAAVAGVAVLAVAAFVVHSATSGDKSGGSADEGVGGGPSTTASSASPTKFGGGFTQEYSDVSFSLPSSGTPGASFGTHGPEVTTDGSESLVSDLQYLPEADPGFIRFYDSDQAAPVDGEPDGKACYEAVKRHPISGHVNYGDLKVGTRFCVLNPTEAQLAYICLTEKPSSGALTWKATGWQAPDE